MGVPYFRKPPSGKECGSSSLWQLHLKEQEAPINPAQQMVALPTVNLNGQGRSPGVKHRAYLKVHG